MSLSFGVAFGWVLILSIPLAAGCLDCRIELSAVGLAAHEVVEVF